MNNKAFQLKNCPEIYPENCEFDNTLDNQISNFFKDKNNTSSKSDNSSNSDEDLDEMIFSNHPDNVPLVKKKLYEELKISDELINKVKDEYEKARKELLSLSYKKGKVINNIFNDINKIPDPSNECIIQNILPNKTNEFLMKNLNKMVKLYEKIEKEKISKWIYLFLLLLEKPLTPEQSSDLYYINKIIYQKYKNKNDLKIIFIIIIEIFNQILIL